jgi:chemotaxis signal transduction protein
MSFEVQADAISFVVAQIGNRRVALPREDVSELIGSPIVHSFPHTTPLVTGVVIRRGLIVPVLDLGPGIFGEPSPPGRFYLVVKREMQGGAEYCAIPVQGECELVSEILKPCEEEDGCAIGFLEVNGERIEVLSLERTIASGSHAVEREPEEVAL